ncbi:hypothetical protein Q6264_31190, partial [Klebsiella pneumoniae]|nr:hypothetical protein [Klebsiella pneumoniae]
MSSLVLAILVQLALMALTLLLTYGTTGNFVQLLIWAIIGVTALLLHCDLVYISRDARLRMPFVNLGLCPEFGSSLILP